MTETYLTAGVAVDKTAFHFDKLYDYAVPEEMRSRVREGCRVMIHFGNGSLRQGMILSLQEKDTVTGLKTIQELLDPTPVLSAELVKLAFHIKERCFCTLFDACRAMLPTGLSLNVMYDYSLSEDYRKGCLTVTLSETEEIIVSYLQSRKVPVRQDRLLKAMGLTEQN